MAMYYYMGPYDMDYYDMEWVQYGDYMDYDMPYDMPYYMNSDDMMAMYYYMGPYDMPYYMNTDDMMAMYYYMGPYDMDYYDMEWVQYGDYMDYDMPYDMPY